MCIDGDLRLVDGARNYDGRVEICYEGVWGTICDDGMSESDFTPVAKVVCKQLGLPEDGMRVNFDQLTYNY